MTNVDIFDEYSLRYWASYWSRFPTELVADVKTRHRTSPWWRGCPHWRLHDNVIVDRARRESTQLKNWWCANEKKNAPASDAQRTQGWGAYTPTWVSPSGHGPVWRWWAPPIDAGSKSDWWWKPRWLAITLGRPRGKWVYLTGPRILLRCGVDEWCIPSLALSSLLKKTCASSASVACGLRHLESGQSVRRK